MRVQCLITAEPRQGVCIFFEHWHLLRIQQAFVAARHRDGFVETFDGDIITLVRVVNPGQSGVGACEPGRQRTTRFLRRIDDAQVAGFGTAVVARIVLCEREIHQRHLDFLVQGRLRLLVGKHQQLACKFRCRGVLAIVEGAPEFRVKVRRTRGRRYLRR